MMGIVDCVRRIIFQLPCFPLPRNSKRLNRSTALGSKILTFQAPSDPRNTTIAHDPQLIQVLTDPSKVLHGIIGLYASNQNAEGIYNVDTEAGACEYIAICGDFEPVRDKVLSKPNWPLARDVRAVVDEVVFVDGARAGLIPWAAGWAGGPDIAADGACVGDVDVFAVRGDGNAVGFLEHIIDHGHGAGRRIEAVRCCWKLGCGVGQSIEPAVVGVGKPNRATFVDEQIIDAVEVIAKVVVEERDGLVRVRVQSADARPLFCAPDGVVATGSSCTLLDEYTNRAREICSPQ